MLQKDVTWVCNQLPEFVRIERRDTICLIKFLCSKIVHETSKQNAIEVLANT